MLAFGGFEPFKSCTFKVSLVAFLISSFFRRWRNKIWPWGFCLPCSCYHTCPATAEPDADSPYNSAALPQPDPAPRVQLHWVTLLCWCARCTQRIPVWADYVCKCESLNSNPPFVPLWFCFLQPKSSVSWNHRMVQIQRDLHRGYSPAPLSWAGTSFTQIRLLKVPFIFTLNTSSGGLSKPLSEQLVQCFTSLVKNFSCISNLNLLCFKLKPLSFILSLQGHVKKCPHLYCSLL